MLPLLGLLETSKDHFGTGNVLLGVCQVNVHSFIAPSDALALILFGVSVAFGLTSFASENAVKVGSGFVLASGLNSVALGAPLHKNLLSSFDISHVF